MAGGFFFILLGAFQALLSLLTLALCINVIYRAVSAPGRDDRARCGRCRYELAHPIPRNCPECGIDTAEGGVLNRRLAARYRGSLPAALIAWTILSMVGGMFLLGLVMSMQSSGGYRTSTSSTSITPTTDWNADGTSAELQYQIMFDVEATGRAGEPAEEGSIEIEMSGEVPRTAKVAIDLRSRAYEVMDSSGAVLLRGTDAAADAESMMKALYESSGLDTADAGIVEEYEDAASIVQMSIEDPSGFRNARSNAESAAFLSENDLPLGTGGGSSSSFPAPPRLFGLRSEGAIAAVVGLPVLLIYGSGVGALVWRRRRLLAERGGSS